MMQFDVRAADSLWEGSAPPQDAPRWYGDVSGLIETSRGPAEPHELVDEPIVVKHMHRTTLAGRPRDCHRGRTLGRVIAVKAGAATAASVFGVTVAVAAAATTGVVASMARLAAPVIKEHVVLAQDGPESLVGTQETHLDDQLMALTEAPAAIPTPATSPPPATPDRPAASVTHAPATPAVEPTAGAAPPATPARSSRWRPRRSPPPQSRRRQPRPPNQRTPNTRRRPRRRGPTPRQTRHSNSNLHPRRDRHRRPNVAARRHTRRTRRTLRIRHRRSGRARAPAESGRPANSPPGVDQCGTGRPAQSRPPAGVRRRLRAGTTRRPGNRGW
jgi:hypothetical protein